MGASASQDDFNAGDEDPHLPGGNKTEDNKEKWVY